MNAVVKVFNQRFYVKELLLLLASYLFMEGMFSWFFVHDSAIVENYQKTASLFIFAFVLYSFRKLTKTEQAYIAIFSLIMVKLVFESLAGYNTVFKQFTMFTVLFPVVFMFFIKHLLRSLDIDLLEFLAKFYLLSYIIFMLLYGRGFSFGLESTDLEDYGPFSGDTRILHASHIFMMVIPLLWYLNRSVATGKMAFILPFVFCVAVILVHQHRSVWSSALVALFFYLVACVRNGIISIRRVMSVALLLGILGAIAWVFMASLSPGFTDFLNERFAEIFNPAKEGSTGNFRILQRETYFALYLERPFLGWTFEGFSMANPLVDWWPENTGQHFHEGYIEVLFYHGAIGLLFKYSILLYMLVKIFSRKLSEKSIILLAFCISGLVFSLNYVLPLVFWGHAGACLFYLEKDRAS
jgi:O-Antigen ligase